MTFVVHFVLKKKRFVGHNRGAGFCFAVTNRTVSAAHSLHLDNVKRLNLVQYKRQQGYIEEENARCLYMGDGDSAELYEKRPRLANTVWQRVYTTTRLPRDLSPATSSTNCHKEREKVCPCFHPKRLVIFVSCIAQMVLRRSADQILSLHAQPDYWEVCLRQLPPHVVHRCDMMSFFQE
jgi:hypothetical protein